MNSRIFAGHISSLHERYQDPESVDFKMVVENQRRCDAYLRQNMGALLNGRYEVELYARDDGQFTSRQIWVQAFVDEFRSCRDVSKELRVMSNDAVGNQGSHSLQYN